MKVYLLHQPYFSKELVMNSIVTVFGSSFNILSLHSTVALLNNHKYMLLHIQYFMSTVQRTLSVTAQSLKELSGLLI